MEKSDVVSLEKMEKANQIVAGVHELVESEIAPGVDSESLDEMAEEYIRSHDATPAFKGYRGYPKTLNVSINEQVVHGIPSKEQVINDGDLVSIDVGACYEGNYGDSALTVGVGSVDPAAEKLMEVTRRALYKGINKARVGNRLGAVCNAIESFVKPYGFSVVREWAGHFIGHEMHL
ncbi:MAG: type I methionyl aminopeptidase, partial [bacterium]